MKKLLLVCLFLVMASPAVAMDEYIRNRATIAKAVKAGDAQALRQVMDANLPIGVRSLAYFFGEAPTAEIAQILIDAGADVNEQPRNHDDLSQVVHLPPLRVVMLRQPVEVAEVLLQHGADVNGVDSYGITLLGSKSYHAGANDEKLKLLLSYGADPSMKGSTRGRTILDDVRDINPQLVPLLERQQKILAFLKENRATNVVDLIRSRPISGCIRARN